MNINFIAVTLLLLSHICHAQTQIDGKVLDQETKEPIPNATIRVLGSPEGAFSNLEGDYELILNAANEDSMLSFSCVGYKTITIEASSLINSQITIELIPNILELDEVLVTPSAVSSKQAEGLLRKGISNLKKKCPSFEAIAISTHYSKEDQRCTRIESGIIKLYDPNGYGKKRSQVTLDEQVKFLKKKESLDFSIDRINFQRSYFDFYYRPFSFLLKNGMKYDFGSEELIYTMETLPDQRILITAMDVAKVSARAKFQDQFDMKFYLKDVSGDLVMDEFELNYTSKLEKKGLIIKENSLFSIRLKESGDFIQPKTIEHIVTQHSNSPKSSKGRMSQSYHKIEFDQLNFNYKKTPTSIQQSSLDTWNREIDFLRTLGQDVSGIIPLEKQFDLSQDEVQFALAQDSVSLSIINELMAKNNQPSYIVIWDGWDSIMPLMGVSDKLDYEDLDLIFINTQKNKKEWLYTVSGADWMYYPHFNLSSNWKNISYEGDVTVPLYLFKTIEGQVERSDKPFSDSYIKSKLE